MTAYDLAWQYDWNKVPADQSTTLLQSQSMWYALKVALLAQGWKVDASSDGSGGHSSSPPLGTDHWGAATSLKWLSGADFSWIWLKSPDNFPTAGKNYWLLISFPTANVYEATFKICTAAPTGVFSTSSSGTATNPNTWTNRQFKDSGAVSNHHSHLIATASGDFLFLISKDLSGIASFAFGVIRTRDFKTPDLWPAFEICSWRSSGVGALDRAVMVDASGAWCNGHWIDGTASALSMIFPFNDGAGTYASQLAANMDGKYPDMPCWVQSRGAGKIDFRGWLYDVRYGNTTYIGQATVEPASGGITGAFVGHFWLPSDAVPSF